MLKTTKQEMERMYRAFYFENQKVVIFPVPCETKTTHTKKEVN